MGYNQLEIIAELKQNILGDMTAIPPEVLCTMQNFQSWLQQCVIKNEYQLTNVIFKS